MKAEYARQIVDATREYNKNNLCRATRVYIGNEPYFYLRQYSEGFMNYIDDGIITKEPNEMFFGLRVIKTNFHDCLYVGYSKND